MEQPETDRLNTAAALLPRLNTARSKLQAFIDAGGLVSYLDPERGYRVRLHGFWATCSSGPTGAINDWINQVERKAGIF